MIIQVMEYALAQLHTMIMGLLFVYIVNILGFYLNNNYLVFSLTCDGPNYDDCLTCNTSTTNRNDNSSLNKCLCKDGFYDANMIICTNCHYSW